MPNHSLTHHPPRVPRSPSAVAGLVAVMVALVACESEQRVLGLRYGNFSQSSNEPGDASSIARYGAVSSSGPDLPWSIALTVLRGPDRRALAEQRRIEIASATGSKDLWLGEESEATTIYAGHYASPQDSAARADLKSWRDQKAKGLALEGVMLVPVAGSGGGAVAEWDLRSAKSRGKYTLQIGFYDDGYGKDFRKAAEQAVAVLRKDGDEAYFYHGPNRSMLTIGTFVEADLHSAAGSEYSKRVAIVQQKFPFNLSNGLTIRQKRSDGNVTNQPSFLVEIPR